MFRQDSELITDILSVLPLEEMEAEFANKDVSPIKLITFLTKKGILSKLVSIAKIDKESNASLLDIARAIKFYKSLYGEIIGILND